MLFNAAGQSLGLGMPFSDMALGRNLAEGLGGGPATSYRGASPGRAGSPTVTVQVTGSG
jgi:hypothetical protein